MKKKIYKVLSILLTMLIVFSACACIFNTVSADAQQKTYYVRANGDDTKTGLTQSNAVKTVGRAIELANAAGLTTGDTVTIKLIGTDDIINWLSSGNVLPSHEFKVVITSNASNLSTVGNGDNIILGGDTEFKKVKVNFGSSERYVSAGGNNIIFGDGAEYYGTKAMSGFALGNNISGSVLNSDFNISNQMPITNLVLGSVNANSPEFSGNINIVYNAAAGTPIFGFGAGNPKFNKALNIELKALTSVTFKEADKPVFGADGYMQVLNQLDANIDATQFAGIDATKLWVVNNTLKSAGLISLTDTKGVYTVNTEGYQNIKAVDTTDPNNVVEPVGDTLTLPAGIWDITAQKNAAKGTFYAKANGSGDGSSQESPVSTIGEAIDKALAAGFIAGDEVTIKVIGTENVHFGTLNAYDFNLIVTSNTGAEATVGNGKGIAMKGDVEFTNIGVYMGGDTSDTKYKNFICAGNNVTFGDGCVFKGNSTESTFFSAWSQSNNGSNGSVSDDFTIISQIGIRNFRIGQDYHAVTYGGNINIVYDYASGSPIFCLGTHIDTTTVTYNKALNINVKAATLISFSNTNEVAFGPDGYFQIINTSANNIKPADAGLSGAAYDGKLWVLNNGSGKKDILSFTEEKGKFAVKLDDPTHNLVAENMETGEKITYKGSDGLEGFITLPAAAYAVTLDRPAEYKYYYTDPDVGITVAEGTRPADVGTKENPVKSYSDAMRLAVGDGLTTGDYATIYLQSDMATPWGDSTPSTKANVIIKSTGDGVATLDKPSGNAYLTASHTTFDNIYVNISGQWREFIANEKSFTLGPTSTIYAHKFYLWDTASGKKRVDDVNIVIQGTISAGNVRIYAAYHRHESTGDINITWDSPTPLGLEFGNERDHNSVKNTYSGNININIKQASAFALITNSGAGAEFKGTFNILIDGDIKLPYNVTKNFHDLTVDGGKWYITNAATDNEFVSFTKDKGIFAIKGNKTAYSRQGSAEVKTHTGGTVDLSAAPGMYTISDKKDVPVIEDSPYKMLYYRLGGGHKHIAQWCSLYDEVTYVYEFTMFSHAYNLTKPIVYEDNRHSVLDDNGTVISDTIIGFGTKLKSLREDAGLTQEQLAKKAGVAKSVIVAYEKSEVAPMNSKGEPDADKLQGIADVLKVSVEALAGNFHRVVWEFTIPKGVNEAEGTYLFVGNSIPSHDEGLIMDRTVYRKDDPTKKDLFTANQNFGDGLDYVTLNYEFWGRTFSAPRGGTGLVEWTDGYQELIIMNKDYSYADYLIYLNNPQDGKWWNDKDIIEEEEFATYAKAYGFFKDQNGDGISGINFLLKSDEESYKAKSNSKGKFDFGTILTGFYDLYILDGSEEIHTGFTSFISQDEVVEFNIVSDTSGIVVEDMNNDNYETDTPDETVDEIGPSGTITGTVYTPMREVVPGIKVILRGFGEAVTREDGTFGFADVPVGKYDLYTINADGSEYILKEVEIKENISIDTKLKYDPPTESNVDEADSGWIIWVIIASVVALLVVGALVFFLVIKKKKA